MALDRLAQGEQVPIPAVIVVLRLYARTGRRDLFDGLSGLLADALFAGVSPSTSPAQQLVLITEAAAVSSDERLRERALNLGHALQAGWSSLAGAGELLRSVDACLASAAVVSDRDDGRRLVATAVHELERVVGAAYEPGEGLVDATTGEPASLPDHLRAASALLTAYGVAGRVPYSMLADELIRFSRRTWWDAAAGRFRPPAPASETDLFDTNCEAVRVLCRLASLHHDDDYRRSAVTVPDIDYQADAGRILAYFEQESCARGLAAASYALALDEWLALG